MIVFIYLAIIELWLVGLLGVHRVGRDMRTQPAGAPTASSFKVVLLAAILAATFVWQLDIISTASISQDHFPKRYVGLPLVPLDDGTVAHGHTPEWVNVSILMLSLAECVCLAYLYRVTRNKRLSRWAVAGAAVATAVMAVAALETRAVTTTDLYYYVGLAHLGAAAYAPPPQPFGGEFSAINRVWGMPLLPSTYGPLWIAASEVVISFSHSLTGQLQAFRIVGLLSFLACIGLLAMMRVARSSIALFALNPALIDQYVANGHNDMLAVVLTLGAFALARRQPLVAVALGAMAGAVKLPFAVLSALAFVRVSRPTPVRLACAAVTCAGAIAVTIVGSGNAYFAAARVVTSAYRSSYGFSMHGVALALAGLSVVVALVWKRVSPTASWSMLSLAPTIFPWYTILALPYALLEEAFLPVYMVTLPLAALLLTTVYGMTAGRFDIYIWLVIGIPMLLIPAVVELRRREASSTQLPAFPTGS